MPPRGMFVRDLRPTHLCSTAFRPNRPVTAARYKAAKNDRCHSYQACSVVIAVPDDRTTLDLLDVAEVSSCDTDKHSQHNQRYYILPHPHLEFIRCFSR